MGLFRGYWERLMAVLCASLVCNQVFFCSAVNSWFANEEPSESFSERRITIKMPGTRPLKRDTYLCTAVQLLPQKEYIVDFEPVASQETAHHILLFGCKLPGSSSRSWDCKDGLYGECMGYQEILYAWAKDAPAKHLPKDVGFAVGGETNIKYLVLQVHYASVDTFQDGSKDYSGFILQTRQHSLPYLGGIYLLWAHSGTIPPETSGVHVDVACWYKSPEPMYAFAYRTHAHSLAKVITGYRIRNGVWTLLGKGDPQAPQAFYPMDTTVEIKTGDILAARCTYDSRGHNLHESVYMGSSAHDEMCNFYIMYYSNAARFQYSGGDCGEQKHPEIFKNFPPGSDTPLVNSPKVKPSSSHKVNSVTSAGDLDRKISQEVFHWKVTPSASSYKEDVIDSLQTKSQPVLHAMSSVVMPSEPVKPVTQARAKEQDNSKLRLVTDWPSLTSLEVSKLGQVTGVSVDSQGEVVVFHRGSRVWDDSTFDSSNVFRNADLVGTISEHTIWIIDSATGKVKGFWGKNLFYLPHGLTIDHEDNLWVTDVGSHQVFKFSPLSDRTRRLLALGDKLVPGSDNSRFCKPTSVAVDKNGEFFVADGYCNSRIMRFSSAGKLLNTWGKPSYSSTGAPPPGSFLIPHNLALDSTRHTLYVADRENGRVQVFSSVSGVFVDEIKLPEFGGVVYAVDYSDSEHGGVLHVVNGPNGPDQDTRKVLVKGFTIRVSDKTILQKWPSEKGQVLSQPHDLASSPDGTDVYVVEIGLNKVWKFSSEQQPPETTPVTTFAVVTKELLGNHEGSGFHPKEGVPTKASANRGSSSLELVEEKAILITPGYQNSSANTGGYQESSAPGSKEQSSKQDGAGETSGVTTGHQASSGSNETNVDSERYGDRETSRGNPADHQDSVDEDKDKSPGITNPQQRLSHNSTRGQDKTDTESHTSELATQDSVMWVNITENASISPEPTASGSGKSGPQNDAVDSDERDDSENIAAGVIPALVILSVLAVPIVFLLLISILLRVRAYRRDKNHQMSGFHSSKKDLSVGRTRGWWSYMNCCDRQKYRFNRVTLSDFYSDSDSDGV